MQFPLVAKVGNAEAGYGKLKFDDERGFEDFRGLIGLISAMRCALTRLQIASLTVQQ